jgi:hypothetical protein
MVYLMSETEKKPRKRQTKQPVTPALVEHSEVSGVEYIYPASLTIGDSAINYTTQQDNLIITEDINDTLVALVEDSVVNNDGTLPPPVSSEEKAKTAYKMDMLTQIYVGSLTVIGLFVVYRLIKRSR